MMYFESCPSLKLCQVIDYRAFWLVFCTLGFGERAIFNLPTPWRLAISQIGYRQQSPPLQLSTLLAESCRLKTIIAQ
jgi:hypothetical protein